MTGSNSPRLCERRGCPRCGLMPECRVRKTDSLGLPLQAEIIRKLAAGLSGRRVNQGREPRLARCGAPLILTHDFYTQRGW